MREFMQSNCIFLISIVLLICGIGYLVYLQKWDTLRLLAYELIKKAEKAFKGSKRGQAKFNDVFYKLYNSIPFWIRIFITDEDIKKQLQIWYDEIKDKLDDGIVNKSV